MKIFPTYLGCWLDTSYTNMAPKSKNYLGSRAHEEHSAKITATFTITDKAAATEILNWWVSDLQFGAVEFYVNLPFFGIDGVTVKATNDLEIVKEVYGYSIAFVLDIVGDVYDTDIILIHKISEQP